MGGRAGVGRSVGPSTWSAGCCTPAGPLRYHCADAANAKRNNRNGMGKSPIVARSSMTLRHSKPKVRKPGQGFVLPDAPPRGPDDMTTFNHLTLTGNVHALALYLGSPETTTIGGELYIVREPRMPTLGRRIPDLLIAFDTDPGALQGDQRLRHLRPGQAAGLPDGGRLAHHGPH